MRALMLMRGAIASRFGRDKAPTFIHRKLMSNNIKIARLVWRTAGDVEIFSLCVAICKNRISTRAKSNRFYNERCPVHRSSFRHTIKFRMKACNTRTTGVMINTWLVKNDSIALVYTLIQLLKDYYDDVGGQDYTKKSSKRERLSSLRWMWLYS